MKATGVQKALAPVEESVPFRVPRRLPYKPTIPVAEIRKIVKKVIAERTDREKAEARA
ncbi:MAG: hypothetical protein HY820_05610 [Acidobacteria bacterium]|nr:hypothetical protein [Acidobacteriota bacterium]